MFHSLFMIPYLQSKQIWRRQGHNQFSGLVVHLEVVGGSQAGSDKALVSTSSLHVSVVIVWLRSPNGFQALLCFRI